MNNIVWLSLRKETPARFYWDQSLLEHYFKDCQHYTEIGDLKEAIVVIPGAYQNELIKDINKELKKLDKCIVIITSDEENNFNIDALEHPNMEICATYYNPKYKSDVFWLPIGPARIEPTPFVKKRLDWFFAGQVNHEARENYVKEIEDIPNGEMILSAGFAQGLDQHEYYQKMNAAKVVPAPRGNISPDSFRLYEALERGAVPVPQNPEFWEKLFGQVPFPVIENYKQLKGYIADVLSDFYNVSNNNYAWWQQQKQFYKKELVGTDDITVVIPTSYIPSCPSTEIIETTINSVRHHLPKSEIIITVDGLRDEQADKYNDYNQYIARLLHITNNNNVTPLLFENNTHQVGMMREALDYIDSEYILYVEHDTPLVTDLDIQFEEMKDIIESGFINVFRLHFEAVIPEPHKYLMIDDKPIVTNNVPFIRTAQWSQRPHLTTKAYYQKLCNLFSENARTFFEDYLHGVIIDDFNKFGIHGYNNWKVAIYAPEGNYKRSLHTDGRAGTEKFDKDLIF